MFFVVSAMDKARDSLHMARLPLPSSDMSDQAAAQIKYSEHHAREMQKFPTARFWSVPTEAWITPDEMYALAVIASLMLLGKIASEHESTEYDFLLGDDDMMGSMDRSKKSGHQPKAISSSSPFPRAPEFNVETVHWRLATCYFHAGVQHFNIEVRGSGGDGDEDDTAFGWCPDFYSCPWTRFSTF